MKILLLLVVSASLLAQSKDKVFRLDITLRETDERGQVADRQYMTLVENRGWGKINAGVRIPFYSRGKDGVQETHTVALGSIIECQVFDMAPNVKLDCSFESSSVAQVQQAGVRPIGFPPVVVSRQARVTTQMPLGKETLITSLDDPVSKHRLAVLVTVQQ